MHTMLVFNVIANRLIIVMDMALEAVLLLLYFYAWWPASNS